MVIDICTYNGETDLWDLHYRTLEPFVDEFRVISFDKTFSGKIKEQIYPKIDWDQYTKAKFYLNTEFTYNKYLKMAHLSPQTRGADHWKLEFAQKESIKDRLTDLNDDDILFIGDVDEIWAKRALSLTGPFKLKLRVYTYFLNNLSDERFYGPIMASYGVIKGQCLNHLRTNAPKTTEYYGWHFTSMGGPLSLEKKLTDSYTQESYAAPEILANLAYTIESKKDFLGRPFTYTLDETKWPQYLQQNKKNYKHLCHE